MTSCYHQSKPKMNHQRSQHTGFTLVEVLVAIAIFAVLSATGWLVFDQLIKNRDRNAEHAAQLSQLQAAYSLILRDFGQMVPIAGREGDQVYPALNLRQDDIKFNKAGVLDPLQQGLDEFEFIEYRYDADKKALMRYKQSYIYRKPNQNMQGEIILAPIENLRFQALDPAPVTEWPAQSVAQTDTQQFTLSQLPKGIEMTFNYQQRDYRWVVSLVSALPIETVIPTTSPNPNGNSNKSDPNTQNNTTNTPNRIS